MSRGYSFFIFLGFFCSFAFCEWEDLAIGWAKIPRPSRGTLSGSNIYIKCELKNQSRFEVDVPSSAEKRIVELEWHSPFTLKVKYSISSEEPLYEEVLFSRVGHALDDKDALWNFVGPATHLKIYENGHVIIEANSDTEMYRRTLPFVLKIRTEQALFDFFLKHEMTTHQFSERLDERRKQGDSGQLGWVEKWERMIASRPPQYKLRKDEFNQLSEFEINQMRWIKAIARIPREIRLGIFHENQRFVHACSNTMMKNRPILFPFLDLILKDF